MNRISREISVVIPCYNSENTIAKCITSVFKQTILPKEIIVIDDGSKDQTVIKLQELQKKCPREIDFVILQQTNSGPSVARNNGILKSKYSWIAFLDSDDLWLKDKIKIETEFLDSNEDIKILGATMLSTPLQITFKKLLFKNYFQTSSVIVSKECISKALFNEKQKYGEDYRAWLEITYDNKAYIIPPLRAFPIDQRSTAFGGEGLSSNLIKMFSGEISNFQNLYKLKKISLTQFLIINVFSFLKFIRRCLLKSLRN